MIIIKAIILWDNSPIIEYLLIIKLNKKSHKSSNIEPEFFGYRCLNELFPNNIRDIIIYYTNLFLLFYDKRKIDYL